MPDYHRSLTFFFGAIFFGTVAVTAAAVSLQGCSPFFETGYYDSVGDAGGYEDVILDMPFAEGYPALCTQGANGSYSHQSTSTQEDIDFDTPNGENDLIYAPIGGVVHVHVESSTKNFGYHVNIDRGNGSYVVVAHMADIFVADGEQVAAGQLIGYEGCTGSCSGDHVHVGLHEGDAGSMAEFGRSHAVSYFLDDATSSDEGEVITSEDFICGTSSGHVYQSRLPVGYWHPNGSLVKTPDDNNVYLIEDGTRHWIETEDVFWSRNYDFQDVALVSPEELGCYDVGEAVSTASEVSAVSDEDGNAWILVGASDETGRYRLQVRDTAYDAVMASWGIGFRLNDPPVYDTDSDDLLATYPASASAATFRSGTLLKEESKSDVYVVSGGVAMPIETYDVLLKLGWGNRSVLTVGDGEVEAIEGEVGSCSADSYCVNEALIESCQTDGAIDLSQGGVENTDGADEDTDTEDESETENKDPSSMLEGEIDDGEFGFAFAPPDGFDAVQSLLIGTVVTEDGNVLDDAVVLMVNGDNGDVVYTTNAFPDGGVDFYFIVQESEEMGYHYGCELNDSGEPEAWGSSYAEFAGEELSVDVTSEYDTGIGCSLRVHVPLGTIDPNKVDADEDGFVVEDDCDDEDLSVNPAAIEVCDSVDNDCDGEVDEGDACLSEESEDGEEADTAEPTETDTAEPIEEEEEEEETTSSVGEVEICYLPGDTMSAGQLYLDGGFFTAWDTAPADSASSGDVEMCAVELVASGEEIKLNAWYMSATSGSLQWAAFNDSCLAIDWQGMVTVDGASVSVSTEPWSAAAWASDPCMTGGDAYFNIP